MRYSSKYERASRLAPVDKQRIQLQRTHRYDIRARAADLVATSGVGQVD